MTPQTIKFQNRPSTVNPISRLNFRTIRPIERTELPLGRGRGRNSKLLNLKVVQEFNALLNQIITTGLNPYEIVAEIDISGEEVLAEAAKRKSFPQTFKKLLRDAVKLHGLRGKVDVVEADKGKRFFVVGREI